MPYFAPLLPEISGCHLASINLELEYALRILNPDFETPLIPWAGPPGEQFGFLRIGFEGPIGASHRRAWIYIPYGSPHYNNPFYIEVITEWIEGLRHGAPCQIHISKAHRESTIVLV